MKKILILGAGYFERIVIQKAKSLNYYVIAVDDNPEAVGFSEVDHKVVMHLSNQDSCLSVAQINRIDGVIAPVSRIGALTANYIAQQLNLPSLKPEIAYLLTDKAALRQRLIELNIGTYQQLYRIEDLNELDMISSLLKYPVIVKPTDIPHSKDTKKVEHGSELYDACRVILASSPSSHILIEDYVKGHEYSAEVLTYRGQIYILGIMSKNMMPSVNFFEVGLSLPSRLGNEIFIRQAIIDVIKKLGIDFGSVTLNFIITENQLLHVVSLNSKVGHNLIATHIIPKAFHYDYIGNLIRATVGDLIVTPPNQHIKNIVTHTLFLEPHVLERIQDIQAFEYKHRVKLFIIENDEGIKDQLPLGNYPLVFCSLFSVEDSLIRANDNISRAIEEIEKVYALQ